MFCYLSTLFSKNIFFCPVLYLLSIARTALDTWMGSIHSCWINHSPKSTMSSTAKPALHFPMFYTNFPQWQSFPEFPRQLLLSLFQYFPSQYSPNWWISIDGLEGSVFGPLFMQLTRQSYSDLQLPLSTVSWWLPDHNIQPWSLS